MAVQIACMSQCVRTWVVWITLERYQEIDARSVIDVRSVIAVRSAIKGYEREQEQQHFFSWRAARLASKYDHHTTPHDTIILSFPRFGKTAHTING